MAFFLKEHSMGMLKKLFGPSQKELWTNLADQIGGTFTKGNLSHGDAVRVQVDEWEVVLDTYTINTQNTVITLTRMRAPFINKDGFYFKIYPEGFFSKIGKALGMQDIQIGDDFFDSKYIIKSNNPDKAMAFFMDSELKKLIQAQENIHLHIKDDEGVFKKKFPDGVDELYFETSGVVKDIDKLKNLFELFSRALHRLAVVDSAYEDDPGVRL
jgi:hypothetical protein